MTLAQAQAQFATLVLRIVPGLSADDLGDIQTQLANLDVHLPTTPDFNALRDAIDELQPALVAGITQAVIADLQSRDTVIDTLTTFLSQTAADAQAKARGLTLAQPKAIADTLNTVATSVKSIRDAAKAGDFAQALTKAQTLQGQLQQVQAALNG